MFSWWDQRKAKQLARASPTRWSKARPAPLNITIRQRTGQTRKSPAVHSHKAAQRATNVKTILRKERLPIHISPPQLTRNLRVQWLEGFFSWQAVNWSLLILKPTTITNDISADTSALNTEKKWTDTVLGRRLCLQCFTSLLKWGVPWKERICSPWEHFFSF